MSVAVRLKVTNVSNSNDMRIYRECQKMYTQFRMSLSFSNDNYSSAIFFDCPACRMLTLAFL
jgi:hypothetical protein